MALALCQSPYRLHICGRITPVGQRPPGGCKGLQELATVAKKDQVCQVEKGCSWPLCGSDRVGH